METTGASRLLRFGNFEADLRTGELRKAGRKVSLQEQPFKVLVMLLDRPGEMVSREELRERVWSPDTFVDFDTGLNKAVGKIREVLGDSADFPRFIETLPRRGYRFIAAVEVVGTDAGVALAHEAPSASIPSSSQVSPVPRSLRWRYAAVLACGVALLTAGMFWALLRPGGQRVKTDSLVVLPFLNLSEDRAKEYLSDGFTEELTTALSEVEGLRVVARTSAFQFKGKPQDIRTIGRQLHAGSVVEGSLREDGDQIRVTVQLNRATDGFHVWSKAWVRKRQEVFDVEREIAQTIAKSLGYTVERPLARHQPSLDARNLYLRARFLSNQTVPKAVYEALEYLRQAIAKDPQYAAAYTSIADNHTILAYAHAEEPTNACAAARTASDRALALEPALPEAHSSRALILLNCDWDWNGAEQEFRRAIALDPNDGHVWHWYSHHFAAVGRLDDSLAASRRALQLEPLDFLINDHVSWHYLMARDYRSAIAAGLRVAELYPERWLTYHHIAEAYENLGELDKAIEASYQASTDPRLGELRSELKSGGPRGYWRARLERALKNPTESPFTLASFCAHLSDRERTLEYLEKSAEAHEAELIYIKRYAVFDQLRSDPRFLAVLAKLGLPR
jgi:TolB-like protein/DNA-binding winged helix-turn-helix (wHTH) protein/tetratricopeptide (TPR) repeat protein